MATLKEFLEQRVATWARLNHPALMERFVLRAGKAFEPRPRIGRTGRPKECYRNAAKFVLDHPSACKYVEGYTIGPTLPMAIEHAWVTMTGDDAMDPTLDSAGRQYFGVTFDAELLREELLKTRTYGLLDTGVGLNHELIFRLAPELRGEINKIFAAAMTERSRS